MRALPIFALGLLVSWTLAACGGGDSKPDAGAVIPPEQYFGLQVGRCFEYTTADVAQATPDLGVVVEKMETVLFSVPTYEVLYRVSGAVLMKDYVAFEGNTMVLYKRVFAGGKEYLYDPPLKRLQQPVFANDRLESSSQVRIYQGTLLATETHHLRVDVFGASEVQLPMGKTVNATKIAFQEKLEDGTAAARPEYRTFVPGTGDQAAADGFVKIDFNFDADEAQDNLVYKLQKVRDLGADPSTANPPCGSAP